MSDYYAQGGACKTCTCKSYRDRYAFKTPEQMEAKRQRGVAYREKNRSSVNERARAQNKKPHTVAWRQAYYSAEASDGFIRTLLSKRSPLKSSDFPPELIEAKRIQLQILRRIRDGNNT